MTRNTDLSYFMKRDERVLLLAFAYMAVLSRQSRRQQNAGNPKPTRVSQQLTFASGGAR